LKSIALQNVFDEFFVDICTLAYKHPRLKIRNPFMLDLSRFRVLFTPSPESVAKPIEQFQSEISRGLNGETSSIAMHPSYVSRPTGREVGEFVALDLGGSNVRVTVVELAGDGTVKVKRHETFRLSGFGGEADSLFDPIVEFMGGVLEDGQSYNLGFIFAFPTEQLGVNRGLLTKWTKEFAFRGVEGNDVAMLLEQSITRKAATFQALQSVSVTALANDTVGVLATGAYLDSRCDMGLIVGTGTNMAVAVDRGLVGRSLPPTVGNPDEMLFNMECGNFDGVRSIQTPFDIALDAESDSQGQFLEKMISGRYLGEIVRLVVAELSARSGNFSCWTGQNSVFDVPYGFTTEHLSDIAHDETHELAGTGILLRRLGVGVTTTDDRKFLKKICQLVVGRSARMVAMCIAATTLYIDPHLKHQHVVAVDGSLFRGYPGYQERVQAGLNEMLGDSAAERVQVSYVRDGSGVGAAIIAAVAGTAGS
jgi:hexokinase